MSCMNQGRRGGALIFSGFATPYFARDAKFLDYFRCYPVAMMASASSKDDANFGGKIFLPPSALNKLTMLHIRYPMLFELESEEMGLKTHSGVLEFVAEEGRAYLPQWMMSTLRIQPGALLKITNTDVPLGLFVKIEPQSVDFLDITDPKAVLENVLRRFTTLTEGDIIEISYNDTIYGIKVLEAKPELASRAICVVETDLETDFAPPVGYVEPDYKAESTRTQTPVPLQQGAMSRAIEYAQLVSRTNSKPDPFASLGHKLSGKAVEEKLEVVSYALEDIKLDGVPAPLVLPQGQLFFGFPVTAVEREEVVEEEIQGVFKGEGQSLRQSRKRKDKSGMEFFSQKDKARSPPEVIEID
ncbi:hypothetical protein BABINDRAFT_7732 [Babjeviella inositovora NRRL Y-12698]|uniref:Ubiquitin fusion degradation protein 1 n=1 Tax=Babjeviella inositovora NRRL Y-12698 TaxID=984486 RepID=A0A1E3QRL5_9ASCO|nr:uncharacterized protein BABINDRAFT_7732 [Babjeviella inositovora NRRL Y-12698]ODQ80278.1 hypothetical protein BABINDRAFT_7732 [Babjeviella inositovora NRRL Y-12698]